MAENKLTPKEIIKALECCNKPSSKNACYDCPFHHSEGRCNENMLTSTIDLINHQQETIETLRKCIEQHHIIRKDGKSPLSSLKAEFGAEAIKEFIEKLKEKKHIAIPFDGYPVDENDWAIYGEDIDEAYKEIVGELNGKSLDS